MSVCLAACESKRYSLPCMVYVGPVPPRSAASPVSPATTRRDTAHILQPGRHLIPRSLHVLHTHIVRVTELKEWTRGNVCSNVNKVEEEVVWKI